MHVHTHTYLFYCCRKICPVLYMFVRKNVTNDIRWSVFTMHVGFPDTCVVCQYLLDETRRQTWPLSYDLRFVFIWKIKHLITTTSCVTQLMKHVRNVFLVSSFLFFLSPSSIYLSLLSPPFGLSSAYQEVSRTLGSTAWEASNIDASHIRTCVRNLIICG